MENKSTVDEQKLEAKIQLFGEKIFSTVKNKQTSLLSASFYSDKLVSWAMQREEFKVALLRFVDVLPALSSNRTMLKIAKEYFEPLSEDLPPVLKRAIEASTNPLTANIIGPLLRSQVKNVAKRFIAGENPEKALSQIKKINKSGLLYVASLLGEATLSETEAGEYSEKYMSLLQALSTIQGSQEDICISIKPSALYSQIKPEAEDCSVKILEERIREICKEAKLLNAIVYLDMEEAELVPIILRVFKNIAESNDFSTYPKLGIVLQSYLRRTENDLEDLLLWAQQNRNAPFYIRLVKGAYWDTECIHAAKNHWPYPVWRKKSSSDSCYERLSRTLLENTSLLFPAFGSHNIRSLAHAICYAEQVGVKRNSFELQTLYGMAEPIKATFSSLGYTVRDYTPVGDMIPGMGYLVRRILENTSNESFLRQGFLEGESPESLLKKPLYHPEERSAKVPTVDYRKEFQNCPLIDFSIKEERENFHIALSGFKSKITKKQEIIFPIIGKKDKRTKNILNSYSCEDKSLQISETYLADKELSLEAIQKLEGFSKEWQETPVYVRSEVLFKTAKLFENRRLELAAIMVLEAGKQWREADADVAEAIDFLRFYALEARKIFTEKKLGKLPGENNSVHYEPRGITAVISPWNFPLAIPCGMLSAALVTGNCALLKPSEQTPLIAKHLVETLFEAGLPKNALAFLPGIGEEIGASLIEHPSVATIVFTGSKEVGLHIIKQAAACAPNSTEIKRVICEMGGKNAIIVDESADLDQAVAGVIKSAFNFQGQKCSACSRVYVQENSYKRFCKRLNEAANSLLVGPASEPQNSLGPLIDKEAYENLLKKTQHVNLSQATDCENCILPSVFFDINDNNQLMQDELFAPVLAVSSYKSLDEALARANKSEYALSGAFYSRSPKNIELAFRNFRVGNLYINRPSTGAMVMRQPFGGFKMSGIGSKAGGKQYLYQFVVPRTVTENTMRRGFAPSSSEKNLTKESL